MGEEALLMTQTTESAACAPGKDFRLSFQPHRGCLFCLSQPRRATRLSTNTQPFPAAFYSFVLSIAFAPGRRYRYVGAFPRLIDDYALCTSLSNHAHLKADASHPNPGSRICDLGPYELNIGSTIDWAPRRISTPVSYAMSVCNVYNVVSEDMRGYINQQDLLSLLKSLFPQVTDLRHFQLSVWFLSPLVPPKAIYSPVH